MIVTIATKETEMTTTHHRPTAALAPAPGEPRPVLVRTYSAGVHFGYLAHRDARDVTLERSRRIWRWYGAWTLSEIAVFGLDGKKSKVAAPVTITLTEAIEIIDCTPAAVASIEAATWAS